MPNLTIGRTVLTESLQAILQNRFLTIHLYANDFTPSVDSPLSSFTEASYDTYPAGGIVPPIPGIGSLGQEEALQTIAVSFPAPSSGGPVLVYGFWVVFHPLFGLPSPAMFVATRFSPAPTVLTVGGPKLPLIIDCRCLDLNNP